jgi:Uma2 family endonuclease
MKTVILGDRPPETEAFLARRRALDQDRSDEVWEGEYHVVPARHPWRSHIAWRLGRLLGPLADATGLVGLSEFNLGETQDDFRVPDSGYLRGGLPDQVFVPTAAIVVEILSPATRRGRSSPSSPGTASRRAASSIRRSGVFVGSPFRVRPTRRPAPAPC